MKIKLSKYVGDGCYPFELENKQGYNVGTGAEMRKALELNNDSEIHIEIDSNGGSCSEGFEIYDALRMSGRNIFANIVGGCHSIATIVLLAAPANQRSCNPNSRALIHKARCSFFFDSLTGEEMVQLAALTSQEEETIANIYADRTNLTVEEARAKMNEEHFNTPTQLMEMGFISKINSFTTNSLNKMTKKQKGSLVDRVTAFMGAVKNILGDVVAYNYEDAEGALLFTTASEEDTLAVGDAVSFPDDTTGGTFTLEDGRVVTIDDFTVTDIQTESADDDTEALKTENSTLKTENATLREQLIVATALIKEQGEKIGSSYQPAKRGGAPSATKGANAGKPSVEQIKAEMSESYNSVYGSKKLTTK